MTITFTLKPKEVEKKLDLSLDDLIKSKAFSSSSKPAARGGAGAAGGGRGASGQAPKSIAKKVREREREERAVSL